MHNYKNLSVWQNAVDFSVLCYEWTREFPADERFGLTSQIRRAAVSIPSNIAEGAGRNGNKEFVQFLGISAGSASEVETQFVIANRLGFIPEEVSAQVTARVNEIQNKIYKLMASMKSQPEKSPP